MKGEQTARRLGRLLAGGRWLKASGSRRQVGSAGPGRWQARGRGRGVVLGVQQREDREMEELET